jgi:DNA-binding transcriptional LysR family regulator
MIVALPVDAVRPYLEAGLLSILPFDLGVSMDSFGIVTRKRHQLSPGADAMLLALRDAAASIYPHYRPPIPG